MERWRIVEMLSPERVGSGGERRVSRIGQQPRLTVKSSAVIIKPAPSPHLPPLKWATEPPATRDSVHRTDTCSACIGLCSQYQTRLSTDGMKRISIVHGLFTWLSRIPSVGGMYRELASTRVRLGGREHVRVA
jgi:hypothetical protein